MTPTQRLILPMLASGMSRPEVADAIGGVTREAAPSLGTVDRYRDGVTEPRPAVLHALADWWTAHSGEPVHLYVAEPRWAAVQVGRLRCEHYHETEQEAAACAVALGGALGGVWVVLPC